MFAAGTKEALLVQALKFLGKEHVDQTAIQAIKKFLKGTKRNEFEKNLKFAPQWIRKILFDTMMNEL